MNRYKLFILPILVVLFSCSKNLDDETYTPAYTEQIGCFEVHWRANETEEFKQSVRELLADMVFVEGGWFLMGATDEVADEACANEYPAHYVYLSDFYMAAHEAKFKKSYVNYDDAMEVLKELQRKTSLDFDLPTEAQWEYAARGGNKSQGYKYPGSNDRNDIWTKAEQGSSSKPNELGLYNMGDQVSEMCKDTYKAYSSAVQKDPCLIGGEGHVVRGGCFKSEKKGKSTSTWYDRFAMSGSYNYVYENFCRSTARSYYKYNSGLSHLGYRWVINIKKQK